VEGETDDPAVNAVRRQQRLNLLATLLFSHGTPMLLAGDEFGNGQGGNNNAYAQDNEIGWLDWQCLGEDPAFTAEVHKLVRLRKTLPLLRQARYVHGRMPTDRGWCDIDWLRPDGQPMREDDWNGGQRLALLYSTHADQKEDSPVVEAVALLFNAAVDAAEFTLPADLPPDWSMRFSSCAATAPLSAGHWKVAGRSLLLVSSAAED
jgi:glycogen operon protein